ncbi:AAA family ATPase [Candidatus Parvarchaeota archaeon]|nr:AAA family ATPase [Candidatus Parvarchaeota archaeon]
MMAARVIAVMSPKGGVGKTTVSINLAASIAEIGRRVLLIDANLETSHVAVHMGMVGYAKALEDVLNGSVNVKEAIYQTANENLFILPSRVFKKESDLNAKYKLVNLFHQIKKVKDDYDFIILDSRPSYDLEFVKLVEGIEVIIVTAPEITSILEARKMNEELKRYGVRIMGLVLNRVNKRVRNAIDKDEARKMMDVKAIWEVPEDYTVLEALRRGMPAVYTDKRTLFSKAFKTLSRDLSAK